nr:FmdB family zinc ribbon protein [Epidermidibacterium keratini]
MPEAARLAIHGGFVPTYQYACKNCGHQFETVQSFNDHALTECPECGGPLRKVFNSVGIVFKGSGFYRNDSRSGSNSSISADSGKSESGKSDSGKSDSSSSTSDSKSAGTSSTKSDSKAPASS